MRRQTFPLLCALLMFAGAMGCASSKESEGEAAQEQQPTKSPQAAGLNLATASRDVRTVQLYAGTQEAQLPILRLGSSDQLALEFDLMGNEGRSLSVYFYHADRRWRRDLSPTEYLGSFQRDNLLDYTASRSTQPPYVHYEYAFPNNSIDFRISGNYILRVTEQGNEEDVLFERAFFVTEQATSPQLRLDEMMVGGGNFPATQPILLFAPPSGLGEANVFDYNACFVLNGRFEQARCSDRPYTAQQPGLRFELDRDRAFQVEGANYFLDLSELRVGLQIAETDLSNSPSRVMLEPDYARFPDDSKFPQLNGQTVVSSVAESAREPDVAAEYVQTQFRYVPPDERPLRSTVYLTGSFNGWQRDEETALTWIPERQRYEGELLLKQGQYEYRYVSKDRRLSQELRNNLPRLRNQYTAFIYYADASLSTDRLVAVQQAVTR